MLAYITQRLLSTVVVCILIVVFLSLLVHFVPGDPATIILGPRATPELIQRVTESMDLDKSPVMQIVSFFGGLLRGDLGTDVFTNRPIVDIVMSVLPHTVILALASLLLAALVGVPLGVLSAVRPGSWADRILSLVSVTFVTIPPYLSGLLLLMLFSGTLRWLPTFGAGDPSQPLDYLRHMILPAVVLALTWIGYIARLVRGNLIEVLSQDHIRAARAQGLKRRTLLYRYALPNALAPTVAILGVALGGLMAGAVFVEIIFSRPGLGTLITESIQTRNYPVVRAATLAAALLFVLANFLADIANAALDPRIQLGKRAS